MSHIATMALKKSYEKMPLHLESFDFPSFCLKKAQTIASNVSIAFVGKLRPSVTVAEIAISRFRENVTYVTFQVIDFLALHTQFIYFMRLEQIPIVSVLYFCYLINRPIDCYMSPSIYSRDTFPAE